MKAKAKIRPLIVTVYGHNGVGKTHFAAGFPTPFFMDFEKKTGLLEVVTNDDIDGADIKSFDGVVSLMKSLLKSKHDFKTLVIDSLTNLNDVIEKDVCNNTPKILFTDAEGKKSYRKVMSVSEIPYGKGNAQATARWKIFLEEIMNLSTERKMNIVFIGHPKTETVKIDENSTEYKRYNLNLPNHGDRGAEILIKQISQYMLFATLEIFEGSSVSEKITKKERHLYTSGEKFYFARSATESMPVCIPMEYSSFIKHVKTEIASKTEERKNVDTELKELNSEVENG